MTPPPSQRAMARPPPCAWPTPAARDWGFAPRGPVPPAAAGPPPAPPDCEVASAGPAPLPAAWASLAALSPRLSPSPPTSPTVPSSRRRRLSRAGRHPASHQAPWSNLHIRVLLSLAVALGSRDPLGAVILASAGRH